MYVKLDLERLKRIAEITEPARKKNGEWRKSAYRFRKQIDKAFDEYRKFITGLVESVAGPRGDRMIDVSCIHFSEEAIEIVDKILYELDYLFFAPVLNKNLDPDVCYIDEKEVYINRKEGGGIEWY